MSELAELAKEQALYQFDSALSRAVHFSPSELARRSWHDHKVTIISSENVERFWAGFRPGMGHAPADPTAGIVTDMIPYELEGEDLEWDGVWDVVEQLKKLGWFQSSPLRR